jgi:hypothetical protein
MLNALAQAEENPVNGSHVFDTDASNTTNQAQRESPFGPSISLNDMIWDNGGHDIVNSGVGHDWLIAGRGADAYDGGRGCGAGGHPPDYIRQCLYVLSPTAADSALLTIAGRAYSPAKIIILKTKGDAAWNRRKSV